MKTQCAAKKEDVKIADTVPVITIEPRMKTERRHLKYEFLRDEIEVMSRELARSIQEYKSFEDDLQSVKTDFKAKMDSLTATINKISIWINNGYEFRFIECETVFNTPHDGIKRTIRKDTGAVVEEVRMEVQEMQELLPIE